MLSAAFLYAATISLALAAASTSSMA